MLNYLHIVNKFGNEDRSERNRTQENAGGAGAATVAIVSLNLAIEGDSTVLPTITNRQDLLRVLSLISSDVQVEDCLLSGEALWAPDERGDVLTQKDIFANYPNLIPI